MADATRPMTQLLAAWRSGDVAARDELFPIVYDQLRRLAGHHLRRERPGHTLAPTALVNEVYLRLAGADTNYADRAHFFKMAATMMRRILVDYAKTRGRKKRGGAVTKLSLDEAIVMSSEPDPRIIEVDRALTKLAAIDERKAQVIELLFFMGVTQDEAAQLLGISASTLNRELKFAKAWMSNELNS